MTGPSANSRSLGSASTLRVPAWLWIGLSCLVVAGCAEAPDLGERAVGEVYRGELLRIMVPFGPGGGSDTWARLIAPHLQRHLPEGARIQVVNVPGATSVAGANEYALRTRPDGRTIFVSAGSTFFVYLLGEPMVRYEFRDLEPLLASPSGGVVFVRPDLGVSSPRELSRVGERLLYGGISATGNDLLPLLAFEILGLEVTPILGYTSKGATRIAFQQGETNIEYQTTPAYLTNVVPLVEAGEAVPLFSFGMVDGQGQVIPDPAAPDLPTVADAYRAIHGRAPSGAAWEAYVAVLAAGVTMQKVLWIRQEAPASAVAELREAIADLIEDPAFLEPARRQLGDYPFLLADEIDEALRAGVGMSPEALEWLKDFLRERFQVDRI